MPQLSLQQRYQIEAMKVLGYGVCAISRAYEISKSTVSREFFRNSKQGRYDAARAQKMCLSRRQREATKLRGALLEKVEARLGLQHSPEQISGRLKYEGTERISPETIYQHVYRDKAQGGVWYKNLRKSTENVSRVVKNVVKSSTKP